MVLINPQWYLYKKTGKKTTQHWWLIKAHKPKKIGIVKLSDVRFPFHMIGERVRFKVEVIEDGKSN